MHLPQSPCSRATIPAPACSVSASAAMDVWVDLMHRVLAAHAEHSLPVEVLYASEQPPPEADDERLTRQREAIAHILRQTGLAGPRRTIVEFGSGDGALSRSLRSAGAARDFLLVDRSKQRMNRAEKADDAENVEGGGGMKRLLVDLKALKPEVLRDAGPSDECVVVSNHLCGGALDAAVRCALDAWPAGGGQCAGIVAVTCCHHACTDDTFLGTEFLRETCGFSPSEIPLIRTWSLMAPRRERPAATRPRVTEAAKQLGVSPAEASELGTVCRVLLDSARARHLQSVGFSVRLVHHVPFELTADNVMLIATRQPQAPGGAQPPKRIFFHREGEAHNQFEAAPSPRA